MKRILVTGGVGFIGSHTCCALLQNNFDLCIIDSLVNSNIKSLEKIKQIFRKKKIDISDKMQFLKGDIKDKSFLDSVFKNAEKQKKHFDGVIHFAGLKAVAESLSKPILYWENNVIGSFNLIDTMDKYNCNTIIYSSSATVYGASSKKKLSESSKINPVNPYGSTKFTVENLLNDISNSLKKKWKIAILRYFNPIGAHHSGLLGENPLQKPNNIFPIIINSAFEKKTMKVFGNDWPTYDGTCVRDYIHVEDIADGHVKALDYLLKNKNKLITVNLGTSNGISVLELIKTFEEINCVSVPFVIDKKREGDASKLIADNSKAKKILSWSPQKSLEEMCRDGWRWKCLNPKGYED